MPRRIGIIQGHPFGSTRCAPWAVKAAKKESMMNEPFSLRHLTKSKDDKILFGVCGGLGKYTPIPTWMWRAGFIIMTFFWGFGLVVYIAMAIFMPKEK